MRETRGLATCSMRLNAVNASKSMTNKRERAISAPPAKRKRERAMSKCHAYGCNKEQHGDSYMCEYHFGVTCGDHLVPIKECGCRI